MWEKPVLVQVPRYYPHGEEFGLGGGKRIREALGHYSDSQMSPPTTPFFFVQNAIGLPPSQQSRIHSGTLPSSKVAVRKERERLVNHLE